MGVIVPLIVQNVFNYFYGGRRELDKDALVVNAHLLLG